jgi:hypothetical protein
MDGGDERMSAILLVSGDLVRDGQGKRRLIWEPLAI